MPKVFFVTGCSSGCKYRARPFSHGSSMQNQYLPSIVTVGAELVQILLDAGEYVIATARKPATLESFAKTTDKNFLALKLDLKSTKDIDAAFDSAVKKFGRIDVLINNAGYAVAGPFETLSRGQIQAQFDTNVFGVMDVTRRALEIMRTQSPPGGLIQQVCSHPFALTTTTTTKTQTNVLLPQNSSVSGQMGSPMVSAYAASKFALTGWTEAVAQEMKPEWNIKFSIIEPGPFRTSGIATNLQFGDVPNEAYDHLDTKGFFAAFSGNEPGDAKKGAEAMYKLAIMENPPARTALGKLAHGFLQQKIANDKELYNRPDVLDFVMDLDVDVGAEEKQSATQDLLAGNMGVKFSNGEAGK